MGLFAELVQKELEGKEKNFDEAQFSRDSLLQVQHSLEEMDQKNAFNQKTMLLNQIHATLESLQQLSLHTNPIYLQAFAKEIEENKQQLLEQVEKTNSMQMKEALTTLSTLVEKTNAYYQQEKEAIEKSVNAGLDIVDQRTTLLSDVKSIVEHLETLSGIPNEQIKPLATLYANALEVDLTKENGLREQLTLLSNFKDTAFKFLQQYSQTNEVKQAENVYPLFAKINDQIINDQVLQENGKYYVKYELEDGNYYFAVVEPKETLDANYQTFEQTSMLSHDQSQAGWKKNLEVIATCLGMYYQINEYMRYQEISHKGQITKELDRELTTYKKILSFLENGMLKQYLEYADALSKTLVGENAVTNFYDSSHEESLSKREEALHNLIITQLGNPNAEKEPTTKQIRESLYEVNVDEVLLKMENQSNQEKVELAPLNLASEETKNITAPPLENKVPNTNYDAQEAYYLACDASLQKPLPEDASLLPIPRKEEALYKDINTYLDLKAAQVITNTLYQDTNKGQGDYARLAYLKEGKVEGFTSKYQARYLASLVNRNDYFYLMLVEAMKDYATFNEQRKKDPTFGQGSESLFSLVGQNILEENFDAKRLTMQILEDDSFLTSLARNFDGRYLIKEKGDSPLFDKVLEDYRIGNPMFQEKVTTALAKTHALYKQEGYQVPTRSSLVEVEISNGKIAA